MAFVNPWLSAYQIRPRHRNEEVRQLMPANFAGIMVCDRGRSYDAEELEGVVQQKCLAHLIRNAAELVEEKAGRARQFGLRLRDILQRALLLSGNNHQTAARDYARQVKELETELTGDLRDRRLGDPDNDRLLNGVGAQHDREAC